MDEIYPFVKIMMNTEIHFLLIDDGAVYKHGPYIEKYKLYSNLADCMAEAKQRGWEHMFGLNSVKLVPGVMSVYWAGDVKLSILAIENTFGNR